MIPIAMDLLRIALANINTTVGAVTSNVDKAVAACEAAARDSASIVALPEQAIGGYVQEDLVQWRRFVDAQWTALERFAHETRSLDLTTAVGLTVEHDARLYSAAALVRKGEVLGVVPKEKLPSYHVFYEGRTLARGEPGDVGVLHGVPFGDLIFDLGNVRVALEICEDMWSPDGPMRRRCFAGAELVLSLSASPFRVGMVETRRELVATRSADNETTVAYVNLVGGNDGLVFDGGSFVAQNGRMLSVGERFESTVSSITIDLDRTRRLRFENSTWREDAARHREAARAVRLIDARGAQNDRKHLVYPRPPGGSFFIPAPEARATARDRFANDVLDALAIGTIDYFDKTRAFSSIGVSLSGGRDSLLSLLIAARAFDRRLGDAPTSEKLRARRDHLRAFFMPSRFTSETTRRAAHQAAQDLGIELIESNIDVAFDRELEATTAMLGSADRVTPLTRQNIQARVRAARMWAWANSERGLFVQTSNMSEKAVGYTTIGGDMEGALSVIANVPKTVVTFLLEHLAKETGYASIPLTLSVPASAELADDMEDERDLMPFEVLDACFALYAGEKMSIAETTQALRAIFPDRDPNQLSSWSEKFGRLFTASIYKWVQTPLSLHIGHLDLERERALQLPVVQSREWDPPATGSR